MTDAHCHPRDLLEFNKDAEKERGETKTVCAASSWNREDFLYSEGLAKKAREEGGPELFRCFALHPQLSAAFLKSGESFAPGLELLASLAAEGRLEAVGETGFDLYNEKFKSAEKIQDELFAAHLETALCRGLPLVLHLRRGIHKIFPFTKELKKVPAVIFHSWPGTPGEGEALLGRGINVFFSFGAIVLKNHLKAMASAALFSPDRILLETDAPYDPPRGAAFSSFRDLAYTCRAIAALRKEAGSPCAAPEEVEARTDANFYRAFSGKEMVL